MDESMIADVPLREAHLQTEKLLASISSILIGVGPDDRITRWNTAATNTFGIEADQVIGCYFTESGIDWDWPDILMRISECKDKDHPNRIDEVHYAKPDGKEGFLSITINPIISEHRIHAGYVLLATEITERKSLEAQLTQAQKLESIGQLAAGIAHEINTPIQYVGDNTRFLQASFQGLADLLKINQELLQASKRGVISPDIMVALESATEKADLDYLVSEIPVAIQQSLEGVDRVANIVRAMKEFSHPGGEEKTMVDLNRAIENTITVARNEWKYVADVVTEFGPSLPPVPCFPGELNQVFLNILINASQAIADVVGDGTQKKGRITVQTFRDGDDVEVRISDTGGGIAADIRAKIFDPFFTTKEVGRGTGQGLAISHNVIVEKHNGSLTFETVPGQGTTFIMRLPLQENGKGRGPGQDCLKLFRREG